MCAYRQTTTHGCHKMTLNNQELTNENLLDIGIESINIGLNVSNNLGYVNQFNGFNIPINFKPTFPTESLNN